MPRFFTVLASVLATCTLMLSVQQRPRADDVPRITATDLSQALGVNWWIYELSADPHGKSLVIRWERPGEEPSPVMEIPTDGASKGDSVKIAVQEVADGARLRISVLMGETPRSPHTQRLWCETAENHLRDLNFTHLATEPRADTAGLPILSRDGVLMWGQAVRFDKKAIGVESGHAVVLRLGLEG